MVAMQKISLATIFIREVNDFIFVSGFKYELNQTSFRYKKITIRLCCFCSTATVRFPKICPSVRPSRAIFKRRNLPVVFWWPRNWTRTKRKSRISEELQYNVKKLGILTSREESYLNSLFFCSLPFLVKLQSENSRANCTAFGSNERLRKQMVFFHPFFCYYKQRNDMLEEFLTAI